MISVTGTYQMSEWQETPLAQNNPPQKCTSVIAPGIFSGQLEGKGQTFYLLSYITEKTGLFSGYTLFEGKIGELVGSFVLRDEGKFDATAATTKWTIIPGSGTQDLKGISGTGGFSATQGLTVTFELSYELPD